MPTKIDIYGTSQNGDSEASIDGNIQASNENPESL
jgi:hypothetical protein